MFLLDCFTLKMEALHTCKTSRITLRRRATEHASKRSQYRGFTQVTIRLIMLHHSQTLAVTSISSVCVTSVSVATYQQHAALSTFAYFLRVSASTFFWFPDILITFQKTSSDHTAYRLSRTLGHPTSAL